MKKKIKVGDYIRDVDGDIGQCVLATNKEYSVAYSETDEIIVDIKYMVGWSKNIVDLLQIGDIITLSNAEDKPLVIRSEDMIGVIKTGVKSKSYEITSILTYERYADYRTEI